MKSSHPAILQYARYSISLLKFEDFAQSIKPFVIFVSQNAKSFDFGTVLYTKCFYFVSTENENNM